MPNTPITAIAGVGPGLGGALAEHFAGEGHTVALLLRTEKSKKPVAECIARAGGSVQGFDCDVTDAASTADAFARIRILPSEAAARRRGRTSLWGRGIS